MQRYIKIVLKYMHETKCYQAIKIVLWCRDDVFVAKKKKNLPSMLKSLGSIHSAVK